MWFAETGLGLVRPEPDARAECPTCREEVYARCGEIISWHWAHLPTSAYAPGGGGPETCWHAWLKAQFPGPWRESVRGRHRADVLTETGLAIEFQRGILSREQVEGREGAWEHLIWVFYAVPTLDESDEPPEATPSGRGKCWPNEEAPAFWFRHRFSDTEFWWRRPRSDALHATAPVVLDIGYSRCLRVQVWPHGRKPGVAERWDRDLLLTALRTTPMPLPHETDAWMATPSGIEGW